MKKTLLALVVLVLSMTAFSQEASCFDRLQKAFTKRGSYTVPDDMHKNVIISYFEDGDAYCVKGKARVENGVIVSYFVYFDDNTSELYERKFYNKYKKEPTVTNGISELITNQDGEKFRIVFIDKLKPKSKKKKSAVLPDDL